MPPGLARVDVVGVGLNATDTIIRLPHFPAFDSKVQLLSADVKPGGQVASAMVACQSWGLRTRYVGKLGDDAAARFQEEELSRAGIEHHLLRISNCSSQIAFILVDEATGERTILWKRDARLKIRAEELNHGWIVNARALLIDGHDMEAATHAARLAREAGIPVIADLDNLYDGVQVLLECVDYLMASHDFPARLTGQSDLLESLPVMARRYGCRVAGATLGRQGAIAWDGHRFIYCPGFQVKAMDATGAGDIFHGGLVYGLLQGWPIERILEFSCAAAALNCEAIGARGGIRPVAEIETLMREGARHEPAFEAQQLKRHGIRT